MTGYFKLSICNACQIMKKLESSQNVFAVIDLRTTFVFEFSNFGLSWSQILADTAVPKAEFKKNTKHRSCSLLPEAVVQEKADTFCLTRIYKWDPPYSKSNINVVKPCS